MFTFRSSEGAGVTTSISCSNFCSLLADPNFDRESGYLPTSKDFVTFSQRIAGRTSIVPGSLLISVFGESAKLVSGRGISDRPFDVVFRSVVEDLFKETTDNIRRIATADVRTTIKAKNLDQLKFSVKSFHQQNFTDGVMKTTVGRFRTKFEEIYRSGVDNIKSDFGVPPLNLGWPSLSSH
jgi:hypothetical protein